MSSTTSFNYPSKKPNKQENVFLMVLFIIWISMALMALKPTMLTFMAFTGVLFAASFLYPIVGMAGWIMVIPFQTYVGEILNFTPFYLLTPLVIISIALHHFANGKFQVRLLKTGTLLGLSVLFVSLLSIINSEFSANDEFRVILSFVILMAMMLIVAWFVSHHKLAFWIIVHAIIWGGLLAGLIALLYGDLLSVESVWYLKLGAGSGKRTIAEPVGMALTILILGQITNKKSNKNNEVFIIPYYKHRITTFFLILILITILVLTITRGTILALGMSVIVVFFLSNLETFNFGTILKKLFIIIFLTLIVIYFSVTYIDIVLTEGQIVERIMSVVTENEEEPRWFLWGSTLSKMTYIQWIIGTGPGTFREMSWLSGLDYYAHSVYIDIFVTMGLLGLLPVAFFITHLIWIFWKNRNFLGIGLWVYILVSFATSGALSTKSFWIFLGILYGMAYYERHPNTLSTTTVRLKK
jgi:hypothetical protein